MFTSIDENTFRQAIRDKDYLALKVSTVSTILDDPTFERGETMKVVQILKEQVPDIFEKEVKLDYEERLEEKAWDKRYFTKLTYWFQENFALSRIDYIRKVGRVVHRDTAQQYKQSMAMDKTIPPEANPSITSNRSSGRAKTKRTTENELKSSYSTSNKSKPTEKREASKENFPAAGVIVAVIALVLLGILLFKRI